MKKSIGLLVMLVFASSVAFAEVKTPAPVAKDNTVKTAPVAEKAKPAKKVKKSKKKDVSAPKKVGVDNSVKAPVTIK
jgi:hypothetical protein